MPRTTLVAQGLEQMSNIQKDKHIIYQAGRIRDLEAQLVEAIDMLEAARINLRSVQESQQLERLERCRVAGTIKELTATVTIQREAMRHVLAGEEALPAPRPGLGATDPCENCTAYPSTDAGECPLPLDECPAFPPVKA